MALKVEKGVVTSPGSTGNQTINLTDTGFGQVKALLMWAVYATADSDTDGNGIASMGMGTYRGSTPQRISWTMFEVDAAGTSSSAIGRNTGKIMRAFSAVTPTVDYEVDLVSLDTASFVLNWTDLPGTASIKLHYFVLGGSDVTDALVSSFTMTTAAGTQDITVDTGFGKPDLILAFPMGGGTTANNDGSGSGQIGFAVGKNDVDEGHSHYFNRNGSANMEMTSDQTDVFVATAATNTTMQYVAELSARSSWPTDGFQINKTTPALADALVFYMALRGTFRTVIGAGVAPIAGSPPVVQDLTVGTPPRGGIFFHNSVPANASPERTHADLGTFGIGATDGTAEGWAGIGNDDGNTASISHRHHSETKTVKMYTPSASGTLASEADGSLSGLNVRLSWNDIDSVAREYRYILFGDAPEIDAATGSYTVTGTAANLDLGRSVDAQPGTYAVTGTAATLAVGLVFSADPGTYTVTGTDATLIVGRVTSVDPGVYSITGFDADLVVETAGAFTINAATGTYSVTGFAAATVADRMLEAGTGTYTVTGFAVDFGQAVLPILPAGRVGYIGDYGRGRIDRTVPGRIR